MVFAFKQEYLLMKYFCSVVRYFMAFVPSQDPLKANSTDTNSDEVNESEFSVKHKTCYCCIMYLETMQK
jgi:hypothetical protein